MNGESVLFTKSSRSLETHPLRAFIMTFICSFIAYISTRMGGGVASVREGMLKFRLSVLLGSLLPSCFSSPLLFGAVPLVFLLNVMSRVPLSQLFLQIMILFREALYCGREGLDLSF